MNRQNPSQRIFAPDAVRFFATVCILTFHYNLLAAETAHAPAVGFLIYANGSMGHIGVSLFFILSGYTLFLRWDGRFQAKPYFLSRFRSLLPMYWIGYLVLFLYTDVLHGALNRSIPAWRLLLTFCGMDGYLAAVTPTFYKIGEWFVGCILLLYLVFPLLLAALSRHPRILIAAVLLLFIPWVLADRSVVPIEHSFITRIPEFTAGMIFARYPKTVRFEKYGWIAALPVCIVLFVPLPLAEPFLTLLTGLCFFPLVYFLAGFLRPARLRSLISGGAKISYAVFLVHHVTLDILFRPLLSGKDLHIGASLCVYLIYLAAAVLLGIALYAANRIVLKITRALIQKCRKAA